MEGGSGMDDRPLAEWLTQIVSNPKSPLSAHYEKMFKRSMYIPALAEMLYRADKCCDWVKLADLNPVQQQKYRGLAEKALRELE